MIEAKFELVSPADARTEKELDRNRKAVVATEHGIQRSGGQMFGYMYAQGLALTAIKELLPHGKFQDWIAEHSPVSDRVARYRMKFTAAINAKVAALPPGKTETVSVLPTVANAKKPLSKKALSVFQAVVPQVMDGQGMVEFMRGVGYMREPQEHDHFRCAQAETDAFLKLYHPKLLGHTYEDLAPDIQAEARKFIINARRARPVDLIASANGQIEMYTRTLREWVGRAVQDDKNNPWRLASALNLQLLDAARIELGRALDNIRKNRKP